MEEATASANAKRKKPMEMLCPDLFLPILLRLPEEALQKCRRVCRSWYDLISDPRFIKTHRDRSEHKHKLLIITLDLNGGGCSSGTKRIRFSCFDTKGALLKEFTKKIWRMPYLVPTCLELVCMRDSHFVYVCNPFTEELQRLPYSPFISKYDTELVGFGFASTTGEFKVVCAYMNSADSDKHEPSPLKGLPDQLCEVFTLGTQSWRRVENPPFLIGGVDGAFLHGAVHFLPDFDCVEPPPVGIAKFILDREEWSVLPLPHHLKCLVLDNATFSNEEFALREVRGLLCLAQCPSEHGRDLVDLWFLKDYDNGVWEKQYSIDICSRKKSHKYYLGEDVMFLWIEDDGRILMQISNCHLCYYDPKLKRFEDVKTPTSHFSTSQYFSSFRSLGGIN